MDKENRVRKQKVSVNWSPSGRRCGSVCPHSNPGFSRSPPTRSWPTGELQLLTHQFIDLDSINLSFFKWSKIYLFIYLILFSFFFLAAPCGMGESQFPNQIKDQTHAPCSDSTVLTTGPPHKSTLILMWTKLAFWYWISRHIFKVCIIINHINQFKFICLNILKYLKSYIPSFSNIKFMTINYISLYIRSQTGICHTWTFF